VDGSSTVSSSRGAVAAGTQAVDGRDAAGAGQVGVAGTRRYRGADRLAETLRDGAHVPGSSVDADGSQAGRRVSVSTLIVAPSADRVQRSSRAKIADSSAGEANRRPSSAVAVPATTLARVPPLMVRH